MPYSHGKLSSDPKRCLNRRYTKNILQGLIQSILFSLTPVSPKTGARCPVVLSLINYLKLYNLCNCTFSYTHFRAVAFVHKTYTYGWFPMAAVFLTFISVDSRTSGSIAWAFAQLSTLIKLRTYQSTLLGTTDVRGDLKIFLEGLRCVQSLYGGLILLALLSSLDREPPRRHLRRRKRRNTVRPMRIGQIGSSTSFPRMVKAFSFSSSFSTSSLSSFNCW